MMNQQSDRHDHPSPFFTQQQKAPARSDAGEG
jgi:hypothetical protein